MFGSVVGVRVLDVSKYRCSVFFTVNQSEKTLPPNMTVICCPETSVQNYHSNLRNIPEELRYHLHLKSRILLKTK
jgi:hypothetical protein